MHPTAMINAGRFFEAYLRPEHPGYFMIEIGSQIVPNVRDSIRDICPANAEYIGVDFVSGKGVDVVLTDPYSSVFEHSEMFWVLFLEILRILRPDGLFYLNVPSNGPFHRYPVDCWRFYPDSGRALVNWAKRNNLTPALLESYTSVQNGDVWNDFVAIFVKDEVHVPRYPNRITHTHKEFFNGCVHGSAEFLNPKEPTEDMLKIQAIGMITSGRMPIR